MNHRPIYAGRWAFPFPPQYCQNKLCAGLDLYRIRLTGYPAQKFANRGGQMQDVVICAHMVLPSHALWPPICRFRWAAVAFSGILSLVFFFPALYANRSLPICFRPSFAKCPGRSRSALAAANSLVIPDAAMSHHAGNRCADSSHLSSA